MTQLRAENQTVCTLSTASLVVTGSKREHRDVLLLKNRGEKSYRYILLDHFLVAVGAHLMSISSKNKTNVFKFHSISRIFFCCVFFFFFLSWMP